MRTIPSSHQAPRCNETSRVFFLITANWRTESRCVLVLNGMHRTACWDRREMATSNVLGFARPEVICAHLRNRVTWLCIPWRWFQYNWDVKPCSLVQACKYSWGTCCLLHLHGGTVVRYKSKSLFCPPPITDRFSRSCHQVPPKHQ
jgi:hypothetical protein